ncbi:hypothetical protein [Acinetobacter sp. NigerLNRRAM0016]
MPIVWLQKSNRIQGDFGLKNKTDDNLYQLAMLSRITDKWLNSGKYRRHFYCFSVRSELRKRTLPMIWLILSAVQHEMKQKRYKSKNRQAMAVFALGIQKLKP